MHIFRRRSWNYSLLFSLGIHALLLLYLVYNTQRNLSESKISLSQLPKSIAVPCILGSKKKVAPLKQFPIGLPSEPTENRPANSSPEPKQIAAQDFVQDSSYIEAKREGKRQSSRSKWFKSEPATNLQNFSNNSQDQKSLLKNIIKYQETFSNQELKSHYGAYSVSQAITRDYDTYYRGRIFEALIAHSCVFRDQIFIHGEVPSRIVVTLTFAVPNKLERIDFSPEPIEVLKKTITKFIKGTSFPRRPQAIHKDLYQVIVPIECKYLQSLNPERQGIWHTVFFKPGF
ncbi:MAG TPA: hypothetical protein VHA52_13180 [Candidatus Babeliaceae bacterium]|nr:hypothetical protein [Candidatus Babeliaceae bacterium]